MSKKKQSQNKTKVQIILCLSLATLAILFAYTMKEEKTLEPKLNELTTSYISFHNSYTTDRLMINNLKRLPDNIGKSKWNKSRLVIPITGNNKQSYEIVLYSIHQDTKEEYIELLIHHKKEKIRKKMSELVNAEDGGKILYQGKIDHSNISINMWISNKYKEKDDNNSFEIKIKAR